MFGKRDCPDITIFADPDKEQIVAVLIRGRAFLGDIRPHATWRWSGFEKRLSLNWEDGDLDAYGITGPRILSCESIDIRA